MNYSPCSGVGTEISGPMERRVSEPAGNPMKLLCEDEGLGGEFIRSDISWVSSRRSARRHVNKCALRSIRSQFCACLRSKVRLETGLECCLHGTSPGRSLLEGGGKDDRIRLRL